MNTADTIRVIEKVSTIQLTDAHHVEQIIANNQSLQQGKDDLKNAFLERERKQLILEFLGRDPSTWPTAEEKEAKFKEGKQEKAVAKKKLETLKDTVAEVVEKIGTEYKTLQEKTRILEEKMKIFEEKTAAFISKKNMDPIHAKAAIEKCRRNVDTLKLELAKQKELKQQIQESMDSLKKQQKGCKLDSVDDKVIHRSQRILEFLEAMAGVKIVETTQNKITVEFSEDFANSLNTNMSLTLTLNFGKSRMGKSRLTDVQVNIAHFNIKDIIDVAIETNDVPYLIRTVEQRWSQHYPMLSEIEALNKHHAIDWIQSESRLRVLVGNCGKVMFTLAIPENYPHSRNITLVDSYGIDNVEVDKLPGPDASLLDWVRHLEDMYGEKS